MTVRQELDPVQRAMSQINRKQWLTTTGLDPALLPPKLTKAEHEALAIFLGTIDDLSPWAKGDQINLLLAELRTKARRHNSTRQQFGVELDAMYMELKRAYKGGERKTLEAYATTAAAWPHATRRQSDKIGFSHAKALNNRSAAERTYYMDRIEAENWSVARLCVEMHVTQPDVDEAGDLVLPEDEGGRSKVAPILPSPAVQASDVFTLLALPVQISDKVATWATPHGVVTVSSSAPLVWAIEA